MPPDATPSDPSGSPPLATDMQPGNQPLAYGRKPRRFPIRWLLLGMVLAAIGIVGWHYSTQLRDYLDERRNLRAALAAANLLAGNRAPAGALIAGYDGAQTRTYDTRGISEFEDLSAANWIIDLPTTSPAFPHTINADDDRGLTIRNFVQGLEAFSILPAKNWLRPEGTVFAGWLQGKQNRFVIIRNDGFHVYTAYTVSPGPWHHPRPHVVPTYASLPYQHIRHLYAGEVDPANPARCRFKIDTDDNRTLTLYATVDEGNNQVVYSGGVDADTHWPSTLNTTYDFTETVIERYKERLEYARQKPR